MSGDTNSFVHINDGVGAGERVPDGWCRVTGCDCLILVGLTGVGKTTVLSKLAVALSGFTVLPDRRTLTDLLMIPTIQAQQGLPSVPVTDRSERFEYTRRYRQLFPGGMAHALSRLSLSPNTAYGMVVFDGLRGENEIRHAASLMPQARFLMLDAPDVLRIQRLISRRDSFDHTASSAAAAGGATSLESLGVPELADILAIEEQKHLLHLVRIGEITASELTAKAHIVLDERRNYDPAGTRAALELYVPERMMIADTSAMSPDEIAQHTVRWLAA